MTTSPAIKPFNAASTTLEEAIRSRVSMRAFQPTSVPRETLEAVLSLAARAPSGTNTQPWKVYVLQGAKRDAVIDSVCQAHDALRADPSLADEYREAYD